MDRGERTLMGESGRERTRVWSIVLAGGDGERLRAFVERWLGRHVPKQYCRLAGTRSMREHTRARAAHVVIFPLDHFAWSEERFVRAGRDALTAVDRLSDTLAAVR